MTLTIWVEGFGNLIPDITAAMLATLGDPRQAILEILGHKIVGIAHTYADREPGTLEALIGSSSYIEVAIVNPSAAAHLAAGVDAPIAVRLRP